MNINQQVIEFIRANPLSTTADTAQGMGISAGLMRGILSQLYQQEQLDRVMGSSGYQYRIQADETAATNPEYSRLRRLAEQLESKRLWRRAARQWLAVMDATGDDSLRGKAAERSTYCIEQSSSYRPEYADGGIPEATLSSLPALAPWQF